MDIEYRWVEGDELVVLEPFLEARGWTSLNGKTCRAYCAFDGPNVVGFSVVQLHPMLGPFLVEKTHRGTGIAEELAARTIDFMQDAGARGYIAIADNPVTAKLCEKFNMTLVESPVYLKTN